MDDAVKLNVFPTAADVAERAAQRVCEILHDAVEARGRASIALSGGSTPRQLYQRLSSDEYRTRVDWSRVDFFFGDERCVPPGHDESNYRMARESLLDPLAIDPSRIHRIEAESNDRRRAAADYQEQIAAYFDVASTDEPPRLDLVLLGMGDDGHTASLMPHTVALDETAQWVVANYVPQFEAVRITLTLPLINRACRILFLISGSSKAAALAAVLEGPRDPERWPSQLIRPPDGQVELFVDAAAAELLRSS